MVLRVMLVLVAVAAVLYGGICLSMYFGQRQEIYHPEATWRVAQKPDFELVNDGVHLRGWVMNPDRPKALLYFGGNGERVEDAREELARWFPDRAIYLLPYRGYGASDGKPGEAALMADAMALFDQVARTHPEVAVIGRSLGSGVAAQLAAKRPVERVVLVTPFDSLVRVAAGYFPWLPVNALMQDRFESWRYANDIHCPVLVIRAADDEVVPAARTLALIAAFRQPPTVQVVPDAGHNDIQDHADYRVSLERFLR
ncbi:alpha/beta hydrolase [Dyella sp. C11]|uniref:alpha/beta hydrolase n=1 Tax=Dyella sp. C11 TaxID=2126991 RepID=UPI001E2E284A|nr:alpha/beta hydrolase [Dyella sp. C11]